jgi:hypothetical protein
MKKKEIIYFDKPGPKNTEEVIKAVSNRVKELEISHVVVASTRGYTAVNMCEALKNKNVTVICVAEHTGFAGQDKQLLGEENRQKLEKSGAKMLIGSHALSGIERSVSKKFGGLSHVETIAYTFRQFGTEGIKVAVEISIMASDAGLIPTDQEIIAVAGTGKGADTAVVLKAAHMNNYFDLEIREIIAKPRQRES